nr:sugar ABC transporter ATP-binding protein [uncultured Oscillibacter sp.]
MDQDSLLVMEHIHKRFPGVVALNDVQFRLRAGEIHALLGENGAGKSTLIKVLTGVEHLDGGTVTMEGKPISVRSPLEAQGQGISTVYQEVNLCPHLTVAENIYAGREPIRSCKIDWKTVNRKSRELLKQFDLDIDVTAKLDNYSVAVQQMIAIARAVDVQAKILILDEPTSSLSAAEVEKLFQIMNMLKERGLGIVFVTHFLDQVYAVTDRITVLRNGGYVGTYNTAELPKVELIGKMIGKEYEALEGTPPAAAQDSEAEEFLRLEHAGTASISDVSFSLKRGEVSGFSGLLGSGRSEIARLLFGADRHTSGKVCIEGEECSLKDPLEAIRRGIAFCSENRKTEGIIGDLTIRENIIIALQAKRGLGKVIRYSEAQQIADRFIEGLAIKTPSADQQIRNLSGGNQQKVLLARWLATDPDLLILDEPTRGIDIGAKAEIQKVVMELAQEGMSCVFISSEMEEMLRCCSRMYVLRDKEVVDELTGDAINEHHIMQIIAGEGETANEKV